MSIYSWTVRLNSLFLKFYDVLSPDFGRLMFEQKPAQVGTQDVQKNLCNLKNQLLNCNVGLIITKKKQSAIFISLILH